MPVFEYSGIRPNGQVTSETIEAPDVASVRSLLREQQITLSDIEQVRKNPVLDFVKAASTWDPMKGRAKPKVEEVAALARSLAGFTRTDTNLQDALKHMAEQQKRKPIGKVIAQLNADLGRGHTLAKAAEAQKEVLGEITVALIAAGETSGTLPDALDMLANILDQRARIRRSVKSTLTYPIIVLAFAGLLVAGMLVTIVPTLQGVYEELGANLPVPTKILVASSDALRGNTLLIGALIAIVAFLLDRFFKQPHVRRAVDHVLIRAPKIGRLAKAAALSRACRVLAAGYDASVNEVQTIHLAANVAGNVAVSEAFRAAADAVEAGYTLGSGLDGQAVIDDMLVAAVKNGEATGKVAERLQMYATNAEDEFANAVEQIKSLIEPLATIVIGCIILGVTLAIYLPLMGLSDILDNG